MKKVMKKTTYKTMSSLMYFESKLNQ